MSTLYSHTIKHQRKGQGKEWDIHNEAHRQHMIYSVHGPN